MTRWYIDTSAAAKLFATEKESAALVAAITRARPELVACYLLETELRRVAARLGGSAQRAATQVLSGIALYEMPPSLFREAGLLPGEGLRSLDALHCAAALNLSVDAMVTYDTRLQFASEICGISVLAPEPEG